MRSILLRMRAAYRGARFKKYMRRMKTAHTEREKNGMKHRALGSLGFQIPLLEELVERMEDQLERMPTSKKAYALREKIVMYQHRLARAEELERKLAGMPAKKRRTGYHV